MNIRLAKAISTYLKLDFNLSSHDVNKVMVECKELMSFLQKAESQSINYKKHQTPTDERGWTIKENQ